MPIRFLFILLIPVIIFTTNSIAAVDTTGTEPVSKAVYARLVNDILSNCRFKCTLSHSRSEHLQKCAHEALLKRDFIHTNKQQLIEMMQASSIAPKDYKVKLFINHAFRNTHQAQD